MTVKSIGYDKTSKIRPQTSKKLQELYESARIRLLDGKQHRIESREGVWEVSEKQYMNQLGWELNDDPTADRVSVNISFSTIQTLAPFVSDEDPRFVIEPYSGDSDVDNARLLESFVNRLWRSDDMDGQRHFRTAVFDWMVYGDGYVKLTHSIEEKLDYDVNGDPINQRVPIEIAKFNIERLNPWDVWVDPHSDGIYNAKWVCQRIYIPVSELVADERYKVFNKSEIMGSGFSTQGFEYDRSSSGTDEGKGYVELYEFYDRVNKWMIVFSLSDQQTLFRYIEQIECPIRQLSNYRIPNSPYHMGEMEQIAGLQSELNKTRSQMVTHRRRNVLKWMVKENALDEAGLAALRSGKINDIIPIKMANVPFSEVLAPVDIRPLAADTYNVSEIIRNDVNEVTGVNEYLRGGGNSAARTATEASIIEGSANVRTRHKLNQVERTLRDIGQLLLNIISDVLPLTSFEEMKMYITGAEAERLNRAFGNEDINTDILLTPTPETFTGKYVVFVEKGSTELRSPQADERRYKEMAQIVTSAAPMLAQLGVTMNVKRVYELWFEAAGIKDVDAMFEPPQQPQAPPGMPGQEQQGGPGGLQPSDLAALMGNATGGTGARPGGGQTPPGQPRPDAAQPPQEKITSANSGTLPARQ